MGCVMCGSHVKITIRMYMYVYLSLSPAASEVVVFPVLVYVKEDLEMGDPKCG